MVRKKKLMETLEDMGLVPVDKLEELDINEVTEENVLDLSEDELDNYLSKLESLDEEELNELVGKGQLKKIENHYASNPYDSSDPKIKSRQQERNKHNSTRARALISKIYAKKAVESADADYKKETNDRRNQKTEDEKRKNMKISKTKGLKEESSAEATLAPNSKPADDPKSRFEMIAAMLGAFHTMRDEHLTGLYDAMLAQIGQESANIPPNAAAQNQSTIVTKPSAALGNAASAVKESATEEMTNILSETEGLSEDFKLKAATLFEAAVESRLNIDRIALEEAYENRLDEEILEIRSELTEELDSYLDYVAKKWLEENEIAVESSLRNEVLEEFMAGMRDVFLENNIDIPEEKIDVIESLAEKVDELETRLAESISEKTALVGQIEEQVRVAIIADACKGLTIVEQEKLRELAENIDYSDKDTYSKKLGIIRESHFVKKNTSQVLTESLDDVKEENKGLQTESVKNVSPEMQVYLDTIKRTKGQALKI